MDWTERVLNRFLSLGLAETALLLVAGALIVAALALRVVLVVLQRRR